MKYGMALIIAALISSAEAADLPAPRTTIGLWHGRPVETLPRKELYAVIRYLTLRLRSRTEVSFKEKNR